jgi:hypothetical protein
VEKTYFTTEESFPTVLRRSEVVDVSVVEISPIENALLDVEQKCKELTNLEVKYSVLAKTGNPVPTNALSMSLNGAVDAPVNGGISMYRQAFLSSEFVAQHPEQASLVQKLRDTIDEQVSKFMIPFKRTPHPCIILGANYRSMSQVAWATLSSGNGAFPRDIGEILPEKLPRRNSKTAFGKSL